MGAAFANILKNSRLPKGYLSFSLPNSSFCLSFILFLPELFLGSRRRDVDILDHDAATFYTPGICP